MKASLLRPCINTPSHICCWQTRNTVYIKLSDIAVSRVCCAPFSGTRYSPSLFDITKAFDRVWHKGLLCKRKAYGVDGRLFEVLADFFRQRSLQVALDGFISKETPSLIRSTPRKYSWASSFLGVHK